MDIKRVFDAHARDYDSLRRKLIPNFDLFYGTAVGLCESDRPVPRVLDLGAGTGLLALFLSERYPRGEFTLADISDGMLDVAKERFAGRGNFSFLAADYAHDGLGGGYDIVASALSIHHLEDRDKKGLYARIYQSLRPGGVFVNADQFLAPDAAIMDVYLKHWHDAMVEAGTTPDEVAAAEERMKFDRPATVNKNLDWLRRAGFRSADIYYKYYTFGVISGKKGK